MAGAQGCDVTEHVKSRLYGRKGEKMVLGKGKGQNRDRVGVGGSCWAAANRAGPRWQMGTDDFPGVPALQGHFVGSHSAAVAVGERGKDSEGKPRV